MNDDTKTEIHLVGNSVADLREMKVLAPGGWNEAMCLLVQAAAVNLDFEYALRKAAEYIETAAPDFSEIRNEIKSKLKHDPTA